MKSFKIFVGVLTLTLFIAGASFAQTQDRIKVAYVDLSSVFDAYEKTKEYDSILAKKHSEYEQERNKKVDKIRDAQSKLDILKSDERAKLEADIEKDKADLLEFDRGRQTDLRKQRDEKLREILLEIEKIVREFAEKENYDIILNDRVLIYGKPDMNITEKILKLMNESYTKNKK